METHCAYDSGDSIKNANLIQRISKVNVTLSGLKRQLHLERKLLDQHKREMKQSGWHVPENENMSSMEPRPSTAPKENTVTLNKAQLKEIEKRCEEELEKLNDYIFNVNVFKTNWLKLREIENAKSENPERGEKKEYMENTFVEKKYPRGKIFYVDSDLY